MKVTVSADSSEGSYSVGLYGEDGDLLATKRASPGDEVLFSGIPDGTISLAVLDPEGFVWETDEINMSFASIQTNDTPDSGLDNELDNEPSDSPVSVDFPEDFYIDEGPLPITSELMICLEGYLAERLVEKDAFTAYLMDILKSMNETGLPPEGMDASCADLNSDGAITQEDRMCLDGIGDNTFNSTEECLDCPYLLPEEICNDGMDNDCDGQIDRDTYDEETATYYYTNTIVDLCVCGELTPCEALWSITGIPDINTGGILLAEPYVMRCSSLNGDVYSWHTWAEWNCTSERAGWMLQCSGYNFTCVRHGQVWAWNDSCVSYPSLTIICDVCNSNKTCDKGENWTNCAQDCNLTDTIISLVRDAKNTPATVSVRVTEGDSVKSDAILAELPNLESVMFSCPTFCPRLLVTPENITVLDDVPAVFNASCLHGPSGFNCTVEA